MIVEVRTSLVEEAMWAEETVLVAMVASGAFQFHIVSPRQRIGREV